jgi:hypothetical protein
VEASVTRARRGEPKSWPVSLVAPAASSPSQLSSPIPIPSHPIPPSSFLFPPPSLPDPFIPQSSPAHFPPPSSPPANSLGTTNPIYPYPTLSAVMGNCASTSQEADGKARSDLIDRQIEEDSKRYKRECKILLLGTSTTPLLCLSEGNRQGKSPCLKECSQPNHSCTTGVNDACGGHWHVSGPHIPHPVLIVGALPVPNTEHTPLPCGCLRIRTLTLTSINPL